MTQRYDVVVVGSGNAGFSAALAAHDEGARVCIVEKAPAGWVGGNSHFTAGAYRVAFDSIDDLRRLVDIDDETASIIDLPPYGREAFLDDLDRVTYGRTDPALATILADEGLEGAAWLKGHGVPWDLLIHRQSHRIDGRIRFWGNLVLGAADGGRGLIEHELAEARRLGIDIRFDAPVVDLHRQDDRIAGVITREADGHHIVEAPAVVLASGGFEADARRRATHLGPGWDLAKVRGTPHNTGEVLFMALDAGAAGCGHWSGCHSIAWDASAPAFGDRELTNRFSRQAYPFGVVVNRDGQRFVDEGADFRNYTYAKYGADVLRQPGAIAFQLFDARSSSYLSEIDYSTATASRTDSNDLSDLARRARIDVDRLARTIADFNAGHVANGRIDPSIKDGNRVEGVTPPKSNWATPLDTPPYTAFAVTCGITFTFGGLRIDPTARVLREDLEPLVGLFAAGEIVGGIFYHNYPGGSGLTSGTVIGRRAGRSAAAHARLAGDRVEPVAHP